MKITRSHLAKIIKEEYNAAVSEGFGTELDDEGTQARSDLAKRQGRGVGDLIKAANNIRNHIEMIQADLGGAAVEAQQPILDAILYQNYEKIPPLATAYVEAVRAMDIPPEKRTDVETGLKEIELNAGSLADEGM